ncbi:MAG: hypothetical protein KJ583_00325 [Nanoarchaeota archaeon]|nr:hypothetical protein [Nanoarchaeota archaeon]MBU1269474.1 hypothetical protein [Nanoarchaeota archaeon]MBU1603734.1 hypothetical protein [Nanoarchaeota archaeon]MBU2443037.1 hypothetical protein [Nanoarchaeota archaeon]
MPRKKTKKEKKEKEEILSNEKNSAPQSETEKKRKKINKMIFFGSWIIWLLIMIPIYWPNKCAAFFESILNASFTCPPFSLVISLVLGSLFMAFLTWIIGWLITGLYFYHKELTWKNIKDFFKE